MKKIILNEDSLRQIVNNVVRRKMLNEEAVAAEAQPEEEEEIQEPQQEITGPVPDVGEIRNALKTGGTDNLAKKEGNTVQRGAEALATGTTAAAVTYGVVSYAAMGAGIALAPTVLLPMALGAGLYYVFNPETVVGSEAVKEALDTTLYTRVAQAFRQISEKFRASENPKIKENAKFFNPDVCLKNAILSEQEKSDIAIEIYNATQGGLTGLGTDEDGVKAALKKCKSFLGVSQVSLKHATKYANRIIDDGNLWKVLTGEFNTADFDTYVTTTIESLPFIFIGEKSYTKQEFLDWIEETKALCDDLPNKEPEPEPGEAEVDVADYVQEIQELMNQYCDNKDLDYNPITADGKWGPRTNRLWLDPYLPHVLQNHPDISKVNVTISGRGKWSDISAQLIETFPGYTSGEKGCYRFCKDALSGKSTLGGKEGGEDTPIRYYGLGRSGGGGGGALPPKRKDSTENLTDDTPSNRTDRRRTDGRKDYRNIKISVGAPGEDLKSLKEAGYGDDEEFAKKFIKGFKGERLKVDFESTFQMIMSPKYSVFDGKRKNIKGIHMNKAKGSKLFKGMGIRNFKGIFRRHFGTDARLKKMQKDGIINVDDKRLVVSVTLPPGVYTAATDINESQKRKIKKLLKDIRSVY